VFVVFGRKFGQQILEWASKDRDSDTHRKAESSQLYRSRTTWWQSKGQRAELKTLDLLPAFSRWFNFVAHVVNSSEVKKGREKELLRKNRDSAVGLGQAATNRTRLVLLKPLLAELGGKLGSVIECHKCGVRGGLHRVSLRTQQVMELR
jgi:hypothetical protein